jgi:methyl-accepting chemotaxis protein
MKIRKKSEKRGSLGKKFVGITSIIIAIGFVILYFIINQTTSNIIEMEENKNMKLMENAIQNQMEAQLNSAEMSVLTIAENEEIQKLFSERKRQDLADLLLPVYERLEGDVAQIQFHLPDSTSFLRLHKPEKYGDSLRDFRFTVNAANDEERIVSGLEEGAAGYGFRVVVPMYYQNKHIGSVEYGSNFGESFLSNIKNSFPGEYYIYYLNSEDGSFAAGTASTDTFTSSEEVLSEIAAGNTRRWISDDGNTLISLFPYTDYTGETVGYIKAVTDRSETAAMIGKTSLYTIITFIAIAGALILLLLYLIRKMVTKPVGAVTEIMEQLKGFDFRFNKDSEANEYLDNNDEIGIMLKSVATMQKNIQENLIEKLDSFARGNIDDEIESVGINDQISPALQKTKSAIQEMSEETQEIIQAAITGQLQKRADVEKFEGEYKNIVGGFNTVIEVLVGHIDSVPTPVMIIDKEYSIKYMNKAGADLLNKSQKELIGQKCYENFKTGDCNTENCACAKAMKIDGEAQSETDAHPRGMNLDISYTGNPIKNQEGETIGALEIIVDQTDIKNAQRLADKQAHFQEEQVDKLVDNLSELAKGNLNIHPEKIEADEDTREIGENFKKINDNLEDSAKTIKSYVSEISEITGQMATGNMDVGIDREYRGDFVKIKDSLNLIVDKLNENFAEIANASDQVSSGAGQISDGAQELSQGSTEQASSIEELTASITQIAAQTKQNAGNADEANEVAETMKTNASRGNESMNNMLKSMKDINESSQNIQNIIKVIDDIAFQTNLLALNAAVEAARAGQHGKGFAVVAEEVRNLAGRSADAAKETTSLIEGSIKDVEKGTQIAQETAKALEDIVKGIDKTNELVSQISSASNEQATGVAQINDGIEQVSEVVQNNSATAEESAAASEELASQAEMLQEMVAQFKLRDSVQKAKAKITKDKIKSLPKASEEPSSDIDIDLDGEDFGKY